MPHSFSCPKCKTPIQVSSKGTYGKRIKCPGCAIELAIAAGTGQLVPVAALAAQVPIPVPAPLPAPTAPVAARIESWAAQEHAPQAVPVPVATAAPLPPSAIPVAGRRPTAPSAAPASEKKKIPAPGKIPIGRPAPNELDFAAGNVVAKPKLRGPGFIVRWFRRIVRLFLLVCLLAVVGGAGTGSYFLLKKWGFIGGTAASVAQANGSPEDQANGATVDNPGAPGGVNPSTGNEDPLAYIPADANLIIGLSGADLLSDPLTKPIADHALVQLGLVKLLASCKEQTGIELKDLLHTVIIATRANADFSKFEATTVVFRSSVSFDQRKIGRWASANAPRQLNDKYYHEQHRDFPSAKIVYTPSDRIVVLSELPAKQWEILFDADGSTPALAPDTVGLIRRIDKSPAWVVMPFDAAMKADIKAGKGAAELVGLVMSNDLLPTWQKILPDAKALTLRTSLANNELLVAVGISCASDVHATELTRMLQAVWARNKPVKSKKLANTLILDLEERQQIVNELASSLRFEQQGALVEASLKANLDPFRKLLKEGPIAFQSHVDDVMNEIRPDLGLPPPAEKPVELTADEKLLLNLTNQARSDLFQKSAMKPHLKLMEIAREHAANMAKQNKAADDLDGKDTVIRVKDTDYKFKKGLDFTLVAGENLSVKEAVQKMMKQPGKEDIHFTDYVHTGIGIAKNAETKQVYYYQIFAAPEQ
jgi:uncharacterized protein YkwD